MSAPKQRLREVHSRSAVQKRGPRARLRCYLGHSKNTCDDDDDNDDEGPTTDC